MRHNLSKLVLIFSVSLTACTATSTPQPNPLDLPVITESPVATGEIITSPTPTTTPTETATAEVDQLDFDLPEATLNNLTELPAAVRQQTFPLETTARPDGSISRPFICVADGLYVGRIQLTENIFSLVSAECWYEINGERRVVYVPLMYTDGEEMVIAGAETQDYEPLLEELGNEEAWTAHLGNLGYTGPGHIFIVNADEIDPSLGDYGTLNGLGAEELAERFQENSYGGSGGYEEFGESGDPEAIGGLLVSADVGMINNLNNR